MKRLIKINALIVCILMQLNFIFPNNSAAQSVFIPFLDDFSSYSGQPDNTLWENKGAIVNTGFAFLPPTSGVVTLDILDSEGKIYPQANIYGFAADTLSSVAIRLDSIKEPVNKKLAVSDSIWLSFFIQPGGAMGNLWERIGTAPSSKDSVVLQFYKSNQDVWTTVWRMKGTNLDTIYKKDSAYFLQYLIAITDTAYFNKDFRFRFINYGSLDNNPSYSYISNKGQWNIDYVYMNINRNYLDSTYRDVAFVYPAKSLLKDFTAIPAKHFKQEYMKDSVFNTIVNLYSSTLNSNYSMYITDANNTTVHSYSGGFENIVSYPQTHKFQSAKNHVAYKNDFSFNPPANIFSQYTITHIVTEGVGQDNIRSNDTSRFVQKFENYFSYDDGTAESGIGIEPSNASMFALRYPLAANDTLYCVDIYFNCSWQQSNLKPFYLYIYNATEEISSYKDSEGNDIYDTLIIPDQELYSSGKLTPAYDGMNKFQRYYLDEPLVLPQGDFFVALKPANSVYMNIGFDQNNDASAYTFEKRGKDWVNIFLKGAAMIRPYFGYSTVSINSAKDDNNIASFYPNPAKDYIYIDILGQADTKIFDINGKLLKQSKEKLINIESLQNGIYLLKINNQTKKLIIAR